MSIRDRGLRFFDLGSEKDEINKTFKTRANIARVSVG